MFWHLGQKGGGLYGFMGNEPVRGTFNTGYGSRAGCFGRLPAKAGLSGAVGNRAAAAVRARAHSVGTERVFLGSLGKRRHRYKTAAVGTAGRTGQGGIVPEGSRGRRKRTKAGHEKYGRECRIFHGTSRYFGRECPAGSLGGRLRLMPGGVFSGLCPVQAQLCVFAAGQKWVCTKLGAPAQALASGADTPVCGCEYAPDVWNSFSGNSDAGSYRLGKYEAAVLCAGA